MFKSKKLKLNPHDLEEFIRKQRVREAAEMTKIHSIILAGTIFVQ